MLVYIRYWQLVFIFCSVTLANKGININELNGTITNEFVNNITQINDLLKDLIHNYKTIQKIYRAQGSFENENLSDETKREATSKPYSSEYATQMLLYENEESPTYKVIGTDTSSIQTKNIYTQTIKEKKTTKLPLLSEIQVSESSISKEDEFKEENDEYLAENFDSKDIKSKISIPLNNYVENNSLFPVAMEELEQYKGIPKNSKVILIKIPKEILKRSPVTQVSKENNENERTMTLLLAPTRSKTRFGKVVQFDLNKKESSSNGKLIKDDDIISASFVVNINKSLRKDDNLNKKMYLVGRKWFGSSYNNAHNKLQNSFKNVKRHKKIGVIIITNDKEYVSTDKDKTKTEVDMHYESKEEMHDILRSKCCQVDYGEACLKVVVRKCYKACKEVLKITCRSGCKSCLKEKFKESSKTNCIKQFQVVQKPNVVVVTEPPTSKCRPASDSPPATNSLPVTVPPDTTCRPPTHSMLKKKEMRYKHNPRGKTSNSYLSNNDDSFMDLTRGGIVESDEAKQQHHKQVGLRNQTNLMDQKYQGYILRDRYERRCQEASAKKCKAACMDSYKMACSTYECPKNKKKAFKKNCDRKCKSAFQSSNDSEDSDSDSDSDNSSDDYDDSDCDSK